MKISDPKMRFENKVDGLQRRKQKFISLYVHLKIRDSKFILKNSKRDPNYGKK